MGDPARGPHAERDRRGEPGQGDEWVERALTQADEGLDLGATHEAKPGTRRNEVGAVAPRRKRLTKAKRGQRRTRGHPRGEERIEHVLGKPARASTDADVGREPVLVLETLDVRRRERRTLANLKRAQHAGNA